MARHFFKTLITFAVMIVIGLVVVFLISYFGKGEKIDMLVTQTGVVK